MSTLKTNRATSIASSRKPPQNTNFNTMELDSNEHQIFQCPPQPSRTYLPQYITQPNTGYYENGSFTPTRNVSTPTFVQASSHPNGQNVEQFPNFRRIQRHYLSELGSTSTENPLAYSPNYNTYSGMDFGPNHFNR